ncbi:hypothetical protein O7621_15170 [Solwaraspora sp. WMMD937]|uniref:hypothetical protein n=1 Tax=Solwaraspora sp. WMMD937 TaxID=3016090 RepID=UPI00249C39CC|nr:hypothetical protein [Solwaraspora sp. WMMD937]WFE19301.1 hypothetical protein O7621_15170 [Solwaraspora sp. WMMD937]
MSNSDLPVEVGDVIKMSETDYRYGIGALRLRVQHVGDVSIEDGIRWVQLIGAQINFDGRDGVTRHVQARLVALLRPEAVIRPVRHHRPAPPTHPAGSHADPDRPV